MSKPDEKTVLIVDDEEDVREFLGDVLEDAGFNVEKAADGEEALEKVKAKPPDFISLDLVMPRKSGMKLLYELRHHEKWVKIPVLIVTAHAHDELGKSDLDGILASRSLAGPRVYLEKPVDPETYVRAVCESMGLELEPAPEQGSRAELQHEVEQLVQGASPEELASVLKLLKRKG
jgi:CheY-like chemotaxis protein